MAAEGQSDKMASDLEMHMKQRCFIEFFQAGKMTPTDIQQHLLNMYGNQTVSTERWCISAVVTVMWKTSGVLDVCADIYKCGIQALVHWW